MSLKQSMHMALTGEHFNIIAPGDSTFYQQFERDPITGELLKASGITLDVLHALADTLNFTYTLTIDWTKQYGLKDDNGTWNGIIGALTNQVMDIAIGDLTLTYERSLDVQFFEPLLDHQLSFYIKMPRESHLGGPFRSFSGKLWSIIAVALMVTSVIYGTVRYYCFKQHMVENPASKAILDVLQVYFYQGDPQMPTWKFGRFVYIGLSFTSYALVTAYSGNLVAYLASSPALPFVDTFQKLIDSPTYKAGLYNSSSATMLFMTATSGIMKEVWDKKINSSGKPILYETDEELYTVGLSRVRSEDFVIIATTEATEWHRPVYCDLTQAKTGLVTRFRGFMARKGFPFMEKFNREILHMIESGIVTRWKKGYLEQRSRSVQCDKQSMDTSGIKEPSKSMSLEEVSGAFIILGAGYFFATFVFIIEKLCSLSKSLEPRDENIR